MDEVMTYDIKDDVFHLLKQFDNNAVFYSSHRRLFG